MLQNLAARWVEHNQRWVQHKLRQHRGKSAYWHQVGLFYDQLAGLHQGFRAREEGGHRDIISYKDLLTMNIFGDLEDLEVNFTTMDNLELLHSQI